MALPDVKAFAAPGVLEPAVVGLWRPCLLLPVGLEQASHGGAARRRSLRTRLNHIRRRDNLTAAAHMAVEAMFWFHPLVWWIGARLIAERERACDEEVLQRVSNRELTLMRSSASAGATWKRRSRALLAWADPTSETHRGDHEERGARTGDSGSKQLLLAASMAAALAVPVGVGVVNAPGVRAQAAAAQQAAMAFEVASVKRNNPEQGRDVRSAAGRPIRGDERAGQLFDSLRLRAVRRGIATWTRFR